MLLVDISSPKNNSDPIQTASYKCAPKSLLLGNILFILERCCSRRAFGHNSFEQYLAKELRAKKSDMSKTEISLPTIWM